MGAALPRLADQVRIGDLTADDRDHVGVAGGEDVLGCFGRSDVALRLHERV